MYYSSNPERYLHNSEDHIAIMQIESFHHPIISYDASDDIRKIMNAKELSPIARDKPLFAIVRGQGGGKSRILEEIR